MRVSLRILLARGGDTKNMLLRGLGHPLITDSYNPVLAPAQSRG